MLSIMKKYTFLYLILSVIIVSCNQEQKNHEKEKDWKAAIKAMLKKKREMKLNAKSLYKKYGKKKSN